MSTTTAIPPSSTSITESSRRCSQTVTGISATSTRYTATNHSGDTTSITARPNQEMSKIDPTTMLRTTQVPSRAADGTPSSRTWRSAKVQIRSPRAAARSQASRCT